MGMSASQARQLKLKWRKFNVATAWHVNRMSRRYFNNTCNWRSLAVFRRKQA